MSGEDVRRVSRQDIQLVQNLIERCLQLYMSRKEVVETLLIQAKIEPDFTDLVWQKLEEENQEFFKAYRIRLMVKNQIIVFNKLLEKQVDFMRQMSPSEIIPISRRAGPQTPTLNQNLPHYHEDHALPHVRPNDVHHSPASSRSLQNGAGPSNLNYNGGSVTHGSMQADNNIIHNERVDVPPTLPQTQNSLLAIKQETNGAGDMLAHGYADHSSFAYKVDGSALGSRPSNGDSSVATLGNAESNSDRVNEKPPDADASSFGFLGQIPRNFSLSDLTADFSHSFDILENYPRSPFIPPENDSLLDLTGRDCEGENKRLNGISEDFNYDDFSSD